VVELGESVASANVRRLVLLNGHGGQPQALDMAAQELRRAKAMMVSVVNTFDLYDSSAFGPEESRFGIHAGAVETSIILALDSARVRRNSVKEFDSLTRRLTAEYTHASPQGKFGFAWQAQDLNPEGAVGNARAADAAKGAALLDQAGAKLAAILGEFARLPLDVLKTR
jgi:creatinine amidohydrolase